MTNSSSTTTLFTGYIASVLNIAALRNYNVSNLSTGAAIIVGGNAALGDASGGLYSFDPQSVAADDGQTVVQPSSGSGRWLLSAGHGNDAAVVLFNAGIITAPTGEALATYLSAQGAIAFTAANSAAAASSVSATASQASATAAANSAAASQTSAAASSTSAIASSNSAVAAANSATQVSIIATASGVYPNVYASTLPKGVTALAGGVGTGTGGTAGTYTGGVSGGPAGFAWNYTIDGTGKIASYAITNSGLTTATTAPTLSYPSGSIAGATPPTATVASIIADQRSYWTTTADSTSLVLWKNNGGAIAAVQNPDGTQITTYGKAQVDAIVAANTADLNSVAPIGKNIVNMAASGVVAGFFVNAMSGALTANGIYTATDFVPVSASTTYTRNFANQMAFYDATKTFISGLNSGATFTTPANAAYARFTVAAPSTFQVELGPISTSYFPYQRVVKNAALYQVPGSALLDNSVAISKANFTVASKNLFNPNDPQVTAGYYVGSLNGALTTNPIYTASGFIPVVPGQVYSRNFSNQMAWFDSTGAYLSGQSSADGSPVTAPANAAFARCTIIDTTTFQFEAGSNQTSYQNFGARIDPNYLPPAYSGLVGHYLTSYGLPNKAVYGVERLRRTNSALTSLQHNDAATQFHWAQIGDSWSHITSRYTGVCAADLYALPNAGDSGPGWQGFGYFTGTGPNGNVRDSIYTMARTGTWSDAGYNVSDSPDICSASTTTAGSKYTLAGPDASLITTSEHWYLGTSAGVIQYRWNGGAWSNLDVSGAGLKFASIAANKPTSGPWTLEMALVSGAWNPCGNYYFTSARGVRVSKIAGSGSQAANWAARGADWKTAIARLNPDLISIMLLTNDRTANYSPAQFAANMTTLLANIRAAIPTSTPGTYGPTPHPDILIMMPPQTGETGLSFPQSAYVDVVYPLADQFDAAFIDFQKIMGAPGSYLGWMVADLRHPDVPMSRILSNTITGNLTRPF